MLVYKIAGDIQVVQTITATILCTMQSKFRSSLVQTKNMNICVMEAITFLM